MNDDERAIQDSMNNLIRSLLDSAANAQTAEEREGYLNHAHLFMDENGQAYGQEAKVVAPSADLPMVRPVNHRREAILAQRARKTA
jgi:hypothetical protein